METVQLFSSNNLSAAKPAGGSKSTNIFSISNKKSFFDLKWNKGQDNDMIFMIF